MQYAIRIPANKSLELEIEDILFRPPGRPSRKPLVRYKSFRYQAESWSKARRIVAKVEHHQGELFPRVGFIVTSMSLPSRSVVRFYNKRGTAEQWIKEGKQATHWTRLSCHRFRANEVRLQLSVLAYNLGNLWRRLGLPNRIKSWSLTSLQHRLIRLMKTGGRLVNTWERNSALPPEHQIEILRLQDRINTLMKARQVVGGFFDMINPSLDERWKGKVLVDLAYSGWRVSVDAPLRPGAIPISPDQFFRADLSTRTDSDS